MLSNLNDEQTLLQETVAALLRDTEATGQDPWPALLEIGVTTLPFEEADGGFGGGLTELAIVANQLGRIRSSTPFMASVVVASAILKSLASTDQKQELMACLVDGRKTATLAHLEYGFLHGQATIRTQARRDGTGHRLTGLKTLVEYGAKADTFIVSAVVGQQTSPSLFVVERETPGLEIVPYHRDDGTFDADLSLADVFVPDARRLGDGSARVLDHAVRLGTAMSCVEAHGAMDEIQRLTLDYLRTRRQFGAAIGSNQALQHRAVDMFVEVEQARSMAEYALACVEIGTEEQGPGSLAAKVYLSRAARSVGEAAVQLHGAIGMTLESNVGRLFQRLTAFRARPPDENVGLRALLAAEGSILEGFASD